MNVLILGGTTFLGRFIGREFLARGHAVSIFTRGRERGDDDDRIVRYVGDRDDNLRAFAA